MVLIFALLCGVDTSYAQVGPLTGRQDGATSIAQAEETASRLLRAVDLKFESGQRTIHPSALPALHAVAEVLDRFPRLRLEIAGHTDASGSAAANRRVSEERAEAVRTYLVARYGIDPDRLVTVGYGETMPIASNATASGRALNRRVEFRVLRENARAAAGQGTVDPDSIRAAIDREVADAVAAALGQADTARLAETEQELQARLDSLERRLAGETGLAAGTERDTSGILTGDRTSGDPTFGDPMPGGPLLTDPSDRRTGLLPFAGLYLREDLPIVLGVRGDFATTLIGTPRFQPELAFAFRPGDGATLFGANIIYPIRLGFRRDIVPMFGGGIGFHDLDGFESVLNLLIGAEHQTGFGILFAELIAEDFFDYTRVAVGFRQEF